MSHTSDEPYIITPRGHKTPAHVVLRVLTFELFGGCALQTLVEHGLRVS
jgi:hypothetical protein